MSPSSARLRELVDRLSAVAADAWSHGAVRAAQRIAAGAWEVAKGLEPDDLREQDLEADTTGPCAGRFFELPK
jgi:hypothetical protein